MNAINAAWTWKPFPVAFSALNSYLVIMAMYSWTASDALKSACDKGHKWISTRANNYKSFKSGYNKIRPKLFPKGLSTFKQEHCRDENENVDRFLSNRARICNVECKNNQEIIFTEQPHDGDTGLASSFENHGLYIWFNVASYYLNLRQMLKWPKRPSVKLSCMKTPCKWPWI